MNISINERGSRWVVIFNNCEIVFDTKEDANAFAMDMVFRYEAIE